MSALTASAVTVIRGWTEGGVAGKDRVCRQLQLVLTAQGTVANPISASVLGLGKIEEASPAVDSADGHLYVAGPNYAGDKLLLKASATDAPADVTATVRLTVKGWPGSS